MMGLACVRARVCLSMCGGKNEIIFFKGHWLKTATENRVVQTRLLNSGDQFDQLCNLFDGAIPAQVLC